MNERRDTPPTQADVRRRARALERAGFDRVLVADPEGLPESAQVASFVLHNTFSLGVTVAHAAGFMAPLVAAQQFAALDRLSAGRFSLAVIAGSEPASADGGRLDHEACHARADEYLVLLRRLWSNEKPFDHEGAFYSLKAGHIRTKPFGPTIPLMLGGLSGTALKLAGRHADVFSLASPSQEEARRTISRVRAAATSFGRADRVGFALDIAPFVAETQAAAWAKSAAVEPSAGSVRLLGTPEQVAVALVDCCEFGVSRFVVHGLEAAADLAFFADKVMPLVRRSAARKDREADETLQGGVPLTLAASRGALRRRPN